MKLSDKRTALRRLLPWSMGAFILLFLFTPSAKLWVNLFYLTVLPLSLTLGKELLAPFKNNRTVQIATVFIGYYTLSSLWMTTDRLDSLFDSLRHAISMLVFLSAACFCLKKSEASHKKHLLIFGSVTAATALLSVLTFYSNHPFPTARLNHMHLGVFPYYITTTSWLYGFGTFCALSTIQRSNTWKRNLISIVSCALLLAATVLTGSRGTLLGLLAVAPALLIVFFCKTRATRILIGMFFIVLFSVLTLSKFAPNDLRQTRSKSSSTLVKPDGPAALKLQRMDGCRLVIWNDTLTQMDHHWFFGHGLKKEYPWLKETLIKSGFKNREGTFLHLHSILFWALYHGGVIGLILWVALIGFCLKRAVEIANQSNNWLPLAWLVFGITSAVFCGTSFINRPSREWLVFWGPVVYIAAYCLSKNTPDTIPHTQTPSDK